MAFFSCPKCKKTWNYPVEKCPECFLPLERKRGKRFLVVGGGKNFIPSVFCQSVPYYLALVEDENKNRFLLRTKKEFKIGDYFEIGKAQKENSVFLWRPKYDFLEPIEWAFEVFGVEVKKESKILILPTLEKASHSYFCDNTSERFLEAAFQFLATKGLDFKNVKVVGQSFDEEPIEKKAQKSGLLKVCEKYRVEFLDLAKESFREKEGLKIAQSVFNCDFILNLPTLKKTKPQATENLFYLIERQNFLAQQYLFDTEQILAKLEKVLPPTFTLADAYRTQDERRVVFYFNLFLASFDYRLIDRVYFELTKKREIPDFLKKINLNEVQFLGRQMEEVQLM